MSYQKDGVTAATAMIAAGCHDDYPKLHALADEAAAGDATRETLIALAVVGGRLAGAVAALRHESEDRVLDFIAAAVVETIADAPEGDA